MIGETACEQAARLGIRLPGDPPPEPQVKPRPKPKVTVTREPRPKRRPIDPDEKGYRTTAVCRMTGLSYRQLDYWDRIGFISPSVKEASGHGDGNHRLYSDEDVRLLKKTKRFLDLGFRLSAIQRHGPDGLEELIRFHVGIVQVPA